MTYLDQFYQWNRCYDSLPEHTRPALVGLGLTALGAVNMLLTIWIGFPFALLLVLAIAGIAIVRVPYNLGWLKAPEGETPARLELEPWPWVVQANRWYDAQDDMKRVAAVIAILVVAGAINMMLTFAGAFPFGLLFLLAFLALLAIRIPYTEGWLKLPADAAATDGQGTAAA